MVLPNEVLQGARMNFGIDVADTTIATKRIVLDAKVLLTGIFVPQSRSREVILAVLRGELGDNLLVEEALCTRRGKSFESLIDFNNLAALPQN